MVGKYKVITLCGSTRFKDAFMEAQKKLTLEGNIVISVGLYGHSGDSEVWASINASLNRVLPHRVITLYFPTITPPQRASR